MKRVLFYISLFCLMLFVQIDVQSQVPDQNQVEKEIVLYPNPVSESLHIDFESESRIKPITKILDITGKQVQLITDDLVYANGKFEADISVATLKPGIYFVKFEQLDKAYLKKIVVR